MLRGIHLIRHGQSFSNIGYPWIKNSPLTPKGIDQAQMVNYGSDIIICSPMKRTMDTVFYSNLRYNKLLISHTTRELICEPGDCFDWEPFKLENVYEFNDRMRVLAHKIQILSQNTPSMLIVTHGCVITALIDKQIKNCELEEITPDRLQQISDGIPLPTNYHEMTGW